MNFILILTSIILLVVANVFYYVNRNQDNYKHNTINMTQKKRIFCTVIGIVLFLFSQSFTIIPTGYTGVRTTFGMIDDDTVQNGFNWKIPIVQSIKKVNNKQQDLRFEDRVWSETESRTAIYYENIIVTYQINTERSAWIYANVSSYENNLVTSEIVSSAIKSSSKTFNDTDATNRSLIEPTCKINLQKSLDEKYGDNTIVVNKIIINNADFDDSYNEAIAKKQQAQIEADAQKIENERAIAKAEADAKVKLTEADAEADALLTKAKAEAEANDLLQKTITEDILKQEWINKWDGKLPQFINGDDSNGMLLFNVNSN